ncbi:hypothetical protein LUZ60_000335 [Juncus effusus]|nr:hypothetical protein LUZ60_000335 [Juncus effusus]
MRLGLYTVRRSFVSFHRHNVHISNLIRLNQITEARHYFDSLLPHSRNVVTWNSMLTGYVKTRQLAEARKLFDRMPHRDVMSWNVILSGYVGSFDELEFEEGRKLFDEMPKRDAVSWSTMINGYVRNRRMDDALKLFDRMPKRNVVSWNALLTGYLNVGEVQKALEMFDKMPVRDGASLTALVSGLLNNGQLREAEELLMNEEMKKIERAVDAYNTLIAYYGQNGMAGKARKLFDSIPRKKCEERKRIYKFERNLDAHKVFDEMKFERDVITCNAMLAGFGYHDLIGRHGSLHDALMLIYNMKTSPDQAVWGAFLGACRVHKNAKLAEVAYRALKQIEPDSSVPYVLLHNLHVDEGRLECAKKIREEMDRLGVVKQTGFSWIEVGNDVHVFVSGDTSHLFSHEIYSLLESCNTIVKDHNSYTLI